MIYFLKYILRSLKKSPILQQYLTCCEALLFPTLVGLCQAAHIYEEKNLKYMVLNRVSVMCTLCSQHVPGSLNKSLYLAALP